MPAKDDSTDLARIKVDEDDHDLLTFGEVGERLRIEIASMHTLIAKLEASDDADGVQKARARLEALLSAANRNAAQPINDSNFEKFFGYAGKAKRNLPGSTPAG